MTNVPTSVYNVIVHAIMAHICTKSEKMDEEKLYKQIYDHYKKKGYNDDDAANVAKSVVDREKKRHE